MKDLEHNAFVMSQMMNYRGLFQHGSLCCPNAHYILRINFDDLSRIRFIPQ